MTPAAKGPLPTLELICFGPPTAHVNGADPEPAVSWRKNLALLVYLALSEGARSRDALLALLWPEKPQERARHSLNEALRRLRQALGPERLPSTADTIELNDEGLTVDALAFERLAQDDPIAAASIPKGDFLEGFTLPDAPDFDDWAARQRSRFHQTWANTLLALAENELTANRPIEARHAAERALQLLPYWEPAATFVIRAAALAGDVAGAKLAYESFAQRLTAEIGQEPSSDLQHLRDRVQSGGWRTGFSKYPELEPPLLGRGAAHERAFTLVEESGRGQTRTLNITGEPGSGKTRLLKECCDRLALAGARTAIAHPLESDHSQPWSTLRLVVRSGLADAPGVTATDPDALGNLASIVPDLAQRFTPAEPADNAQIASALQRMLLAIAYEQPILVAIDNAHLADGQSLEVLHAAMAAIENAPIMFAITSNSSDPAAPPALARLRSDVGRGLKGASIRLRPLRGVEMATLVAAVATWCRNEDEVDRLTRRIQAESQGNPFLAVTILRGLAESPTLKDDLMSWPPKQATLDAPLPFTIPDLLRMSIAARTSALDDDTLEVLRVASILDAPLDPDLITSIIDLDRKEVVETLDRLEQHGFIVLSGDRYTFVAPIVAQVVRAECLTPGKRRRYRKAAIDALQDRTDLESRAVRAELMVELAPGPQAVDSAIGVVQDALEAGGVRLARRVLGTLNDAEIPPELVEVVGGLREQLTGK